MTGWTFMTEPQGDTLSFYDTTEVIYKMFREKSIRIFGIHGQGDGDVQFQKGYFENSLELYLPDDTYDIAHIAEMIGIIGRF